MDPVQKSREKKWLFGGLSRTTDRVGCSYRGSWWLDLFQMLLELGKAWNNEDVNSTHVWKQSECPLAATHAVLEPQGGEHAPKRRGRNPLGSRRTEMNKEPEREKHLRDKFGSYTRTHAVNPESSRLLTQPNKLVSFIMATLANVKIDRVFWKDYLSAQTKQLPHLEDVEVVTPTVIRVMGGNPGEMQLQGTNTFLVGTGKARILIDTGEGVPVWAERLCQIMKERDIYISHVLLTHWHGDHTGGVPDLVAYDSSLAGRIYKCNPDPGQHDIVDGQTFVVEGATVRALFTPGHAADHMCFLLEEENALFTGDNVLGHGFTVVEDLSLYLQSLDRMAEKGCVIGYPGHGVKIQNLPAKLNQYIRQRRAREKMIWGALVDSMSAGGRSANSRSGLSTTEIISKIHGDVPQHLLHSAIEPSTVEILRMLADTRKVGFTMQGGTQRWFVNKVCSVAS